MAVRLTINVDIEGAEEIFGKLERTRMHLLDGSPVYERVMRGMEQDHVRFFQLMRIYKDPKRLGRRRYVLTGATRESLTRPGPMALREIHKQGLDFGTRVPHARYLTKAPRDRELGQIPKRNGKGRSAVVVFPRRRQREVLRELQDYMMAPWAGKTWKSGDQRFKIR